MKRTCLKFSVNIVCADAEPGQPGTVWRHDLVEFQARLRALAEVLARTETTGPFPDVFVCREEVPHGS